MSDVTVVVDDRARLVTAVLAAGHWPQKEQERLTHAVHPHAKQTRQQVEALAEHPAVVTVNEALAQGVDVADFFTAALRSRWGSFKPLEPLPETFAARAWTKTLPHFGERSAMYIFWQAQATPWQKAQQDLEHIFYRNELAHYLGRLRQRPLAHAVRLMPNIVYPALQPVPVETETAVYLLLPPPKAVGESPPWPYDEDPGWVLAHTCHALMDYFLGDMLANFDEERRRLFKYAAAALFLEETIDEAEAMAYIVRTKKQRDLPHLPNAVEALRQWLEGEQTHLSNLDL